MGVIIGTFKGGLIAVTVAESGRLGRAQLLANFVHELDDVWLGSGNRLGAVVPPSWFKFGAAKSGVRQKDPAKSKQTLAKI